MTDEETKKLERELEERFREDEELRKDDPIKSNLEILIHSNTKEDLVSKRSLMAERRI